MTVECMASRDAGGMGQGGKGGRRFVTSRVRFVWIVREFGKCGRMFSLKQKPNTS